MADLTMTGKELLESVAGLQAIGARDLPATVAYVIAKAKRKANTELQDVEQSRVALCVKYAKKGENGEPVKKPDGSFDIEDMQAFSSDWAAVLDEPVTLTGVRPIAIHELQNINVTPDELYSLGPFVVEEAGKEEVTKPQPV